MQFIHSHNDRPFPCTICGKRFTQKAHLVIHKRTHTGERPYACHICHKRFAQSSHLAVHKRVHSGEKPFFCNFCGMGFCRRPRLEAHVLQHMVKDGSIHQQQQQRSPPMSGEMMGAAGRAGNLNVNLNQESLDAAAQLIELKMKGGGVGGISITGATGPELFSQPQIKSEPFDSDDRMRMPNTLPGSSSNAAMLNELASLNSKGVIDISEEDPKDDEILKLKQWANRSGPEAATANELGKFTTAGLTELSNVQQQALNKSLVMPSSNPNLLSPTQMSSYHAAMAAATATGSQSLTMSGLVRTNSRVSLIDFTAEDILQHLLSRDDIKSCEFCCLVFKDPAMYYLHKSMHDKMDVRCCNLCGKLLKDKYDFTAHYLNQHK